MLSSCYDPNIPWTTNVQMSVMEVRCQIICQQAGIPSPMKDKDAKARLYTITVSVHSLPIRKMVLVSNQSTERRPKDAKLDGHRPSTGRVK
ncbi:hypothetical protein I314_03045 [Cryptococcus bacillisporus CA1873]|uniref:Uncharacterized protein n=1 Tax=Cryptococcus bacillisporus CA1873 TaxID=1296111 RepID=A0ABR5BBF7_CRYGA|nr:hypothetical protein I314_03045 [Cryptococcus bacillisporus CA1873]|eukprot:KIR63640.1 hypothetical protein I314_03045 [Cryptococcus gattii CA1873]